jgi:hypothetical protein
MKKIAPLLIHHPRETANRVTRRIFIGCICLMFATLIVLIGWQPSATALIARADTSENSRAMDEVAPAERTMEFKRRPIQPGAWAEVVDTRK